MAELVITELSNDEADLRAWYVNGHKVYDYHDPYFDELLRSIVAASNGLLEFKAQDYDVEDWDTFDHKLPETLDD